METISGGRSPSVTPVPKQPVTPISAAGIIPAKSTPSLAQFAINQTVNKGKVPSPLPDVKDWGGIVDNSPKPVGVFKDPDTGVFVTMLRDPSSGKVDQYPTEKALELYAWLDKQMKPSTISETPSVNIKA
jgi:hypothetical protein